MKNQILMTTLKRILLCSKKLLSQNKKILLTSIVIVSFMAISAAISVYNIKEIHNNDNILITDTNDLSDSISLSLQDISVENTDITEDKNIDDVYIVQHGDTYYDISEKFYNSGIYCYALAEYNNLNANTYLYTDQELNIPNIENEKFIEIYNKLTFSSRPDDSILAISESEDSDVIYTSSPVEEKSSPSYNGAVKNFTSYVDTSEYTYLGNYIITGYTPGCTHCCGNSNGITASGVPAVCGRTVAAKGLSYGTNLYIKGYGYYVVEDRGGFKNGVIDMAAPSHEACYTITNNNGVEVYIVPNI